MLLCYEYVTTEVNYYDTFFYKTSNIGIYYVTALLLCKPVRRKSYAKLRT